MRNTFLVTNVCVLLWIIGSSDAFGQGKLSVTKLDGGSVTTNLGYGIAVNKDSSLSRQWFVINDPACPLELVGAGINTAYNDRNYSYKPSGTAKAKEAIAAFEVRFMLFDVWGKHMKTLSGTELRDLAAEQQLPLSEIGSWRAWESDVGQFLSAVGFVAHVRTTDGRAWAADTQSVLSEVDAVKLSLTQEQLEPAKAD